MAYALASGDFNPHHLTRLTARPLGYKRPIAHGMWTLARAIGLLERRTPLTGEITVEAAFKRPLYMPSRVAFTAVEEGPAASRMAVFAPSTQEPHLFATVSWG
jgi:acyl dehydratase